MMDSRHTFSNINKKKEVQLVMCLLLIALYVFGIENEYSGDRIVKLHKI